jgi:hypothetical protein
MQTRQVSSHEIQKITKEFRSYKRSTEREIRLLNTKIVRLQKMLEKSMIVEESPDDYEIKAIKDFESARKRTDSQFVSLDS